MHPDTGTMQVLLTSEAAESIAQENKLPPTAAPAKPPPALFARYDDQSLMGLGVPEGMLKHAREVLDESGLEQLERILPREAYEALFLLAAGYTVEQVKSELSIAKEEKVDTTDFFPLLVEREGSKRQFVVITDAAEMEKILSVPLEQWRIFLHPSQRRLVERPAGGPVRSPRQCRNRQGRPSPAPCRLAGSGGLEPPGRKFFSPPSPRTWPQIFPPSSRNCVRATSGAHRGRQSGCLDQAFPGQAGVSLQSGL